jgi:hypothetical protein
VFCLTKKIFSMLFMPKYLLSSLFTTKYFLREFFKNNIPFVLAEETNADDDIFGDSTSENEEYVDFRVGRHRKLRRRRR